jgi:heptosyltransferase-2
MHIAAATGTPVVALYGSSDPQYTPPLSDDAEVLYRALACSPCFARECPLGHMNCLSDISVKEVSKAICKLQTNQDG